MEDFCRLVAVSERGRIAITTALQRRALFNGIISSVDEIVSGLDANDQTQIASLMLDARKKWKTAHSKRR